MKSTGWMIRIIPESSDVHLNTPDLRVSPPKLKLENIRAKWALVCTLALLIDRPDIQLDVQKTKKTSKANLVAGPPWCKIRILTR